MNADTFLVGKHKLSVECGKMQPIRHESSTTTAITELTTTDGEETKNLYSGPSVDRWGQLLEEGERMMPKNERKRQRGGAQSQGSVGFQTLLVSDASFRDGPAA